MRGAATDRCTERAAAALDSPLAATPARPRSLPAADQVQLMVMVLLCVVAAGGDTTAVQVFVVVITLLTVL